MQVLSPINQAYINAYKAQVPIQTPIEQKPKGLDNSKKITLALAGLAVLGGAIAVGKYKSQHIAKNINFEPAKTLDEAKAFARKFLKIKRYELTDLDSANYLNEGLVNFYNKISENHRKIIDIVQPETSARAIASVRYVKEGQRFLRINETSLKNLDSTIEQMMKDLGITSKKSFVEWFSIDKDQEELLKRYLDEKTRALMSKKEKMHFRDFLSIYGTKNQQRNLTIFAEAIKDPKLVEYLKSKDLPITVDEIAKLNMAEIRAICEDLASKMKGTTFKIQDGGEFRIINHELGHILHKKNIGHQRFRKLSYHNTASTNEEVKKAADRFQAEISKAMSLDIRGNVSGYAVTSPTEFVAETYSFLCKGVTFSDEIMNLYKMYGGVIPKPM